MTVAGTPKSVPAKSGVLVEKRDGVLVVTINRPEVRNATDFYAARELTRALTELDTDPEVAVGIVTGAGGTFSSGKDLKAELDGRPAPEDGLTEFEPPTRVRVRKPLIAAVEGYALGGGFDLVLACDMVIAAENAVFACTEVARGFVASEGGAARLPQRVPHSVAVELLLTGEPISGVRAAEIGLANRVVPAGQALAAALDLAQRIRRNSPLAVLATKEALRERLRAEEEQAFEIQDAIFGPVLAAEDGQEGARAWVERREPVWRSRWLP
ncbi:crotonase/enoyl-CoA hydratase family protein [Saccharothrix variisporea]|uniref:Short chain enoyl-CoA hydratase n=1 Tax=Saccharothrix variisporea TaxID=543527 RepID=A0A495XNC1_9PSEU|nr:crotonase/enoyl-CoA hydratase family protein [Saccharothrix variisporea]RKT74414.1 short chain enoyl-CoA hydratase [Saccharothrix variisporea]